MSASQTPRQDYLTLTRNMIIALQSHVREFEDHPDILSRGLLKDAYKAQAELIKQHFSYLSFMYDKEFPLNNQNNQDSQSDTTKEESNDSNHKIIC